MELKWKIKVRGIKPTLSHIDVLRWLGTYSKVFLPFSFRKSTISFYPYPAHRSILILNFSPFPTFHGRHYSTSMEGDNTTFHIMDISRTLLSRAQTHSSKELGYIYFLWKIVVHKLSMERNMKPTLGTNPFAKEGIFFKPHPPYPLWNVILSHPTHGNTIPSLLPIHKIFYIIFKWSSTCQLGSMIGTSKRP